MTPAGEVGEVHPPTARGGEGQQTLGDSPRADFPAEPLWGSTPAHILVSPLASRTGRVQTPAVLSYLVCAHSSSSP